MHKKRTEVELGGLGKTILEKLIEGANNYSKQLTREKSSPFFSVDEDVLMTELLMLSFWNLMTLFPLEIYETVVEQYLDALEQLNTDKTVYSKLLEYRSAQYTCS